MVVNGFSVSPALSVVVSLPAEGSARVDFGNVCHFPGGLTIGYWKTHTGYQNDGTPVDPIYATLTGNPIILGDETVVNSAQTAFQVFDGTNCSGDCERMLKAQLLGVMLNMRAFPGFGDALYGGLTVADIAAQANAMLANFGIYTKEQVTAMEATLDVINNNGHNQVLVCPNLCPFSTPY